LAPGAGTTIVLDDAASSTAALVTVRAPRKAKQVKDGLVAVRPRVLYDVVPNSLMVGLL
jgi:hypothetical protein